MRRPSQKQLQAQIDKFNAECPVGSDIILTMDDGATIETTVRHEATIIGGHSAVGWFDGITGCYMLDRARRA